MRRRNDVTNIVVPELGESVVEARVAKWLKKEGDRVAVGEPLVELETEKIDLEVSADRAGRAVARSSIAEGADVKVGEVLGGARSVEGRRHAAGRRPRRAAREPQPRRQRAPATGGPKATPTARNVAREHDVKLDSVPASRPARDQAGRAASSSPRAASAAARRTGTRRRTPAPAPPAAPVAVHAAGDRSEERVRMTKRRATIARRLVEAQHTAAMLTTFNEVDMTRGDGAARAAQGSVPEAARRRPRHRVVLRQGGGRRAQGLSAAQRRDPGRRDRLKHYYDIGMAVGAEGGLVVPVLRDADRMSLRRHRAGDPRLRQARAGTAR